MTNSKKKDSKSDDNKNKSSGDSTGSNNGKWMALSIAIGAVAIAYAVHEHNLLSEAMSSFNTSGYSLSINDAFNGTALSLAPFEEFFDGYFGEDSKFHTEWEKIQQKISISSESFKPLVGQRMAEEGYKAKHPVFMVPGFVTSGLELWSGEECAEGFFRRKIWGSLETFRSFIRDYDCWKRHLSLDPKTGLDPDGIRIRNSQGFEAADFWTSAFWVWDRIIQNLAEIGYDGTSMSMEAYDWRMDYKLLEKRDGHFTKLKKKIEAFVESADGTKAVIMGHSMGGPHVFFFLVWVSKPVEEGGGGGGPEWIENHIHAFINLAGPMLGLPKAASALLSGEMKDTNMLYPFGGTVESLFGRLKRHELFSSWGALWGMAPKGGDSIWGTAADVVCPEGKVQSGTRCINVTGGEDPTPNIPFLTFNDDESPDYNNSLFKQFGAKDTWSFDEVMEYLARWKDGDQGPRDIVEAWNDPTIEPLPNAPSLNVYCVYGVGLPTDRMFHYRHQNESDNDLPFIMDDGMQDDESENITYGIKMTNGDGSVPLMSTGYTCTELWKKGSPLNPGNARVITREYQHEGSFQPHDPMRQGPKSSEHCDILGNHAVLEDIIKVVSGGSVENHYVSNIKEIARKVREHPFNNEKKESDKNLAGASSTSDEL